eukprot:9670587-Alexandrium_andersonii.AAC.1
MDGWAGVRTVWHVLSAEFCAWSDVLLRSELQCARLRASCAMQSVLGTVCCLHALCTVLGAPGA